MSFFFTSPILSTPSDFSIRNIYVRYTSTLGKHHKKQWRSLKSPKHVSSARMNPHLEDSSNPSTKSEKYERTRDTSRRVVLFFFSICLSAVLSFPAPVYGPPPAHVEYGPPPSAYGAPTAPAHYAAPSLPTGYAAHKYPSSLDGKFTCDEVINLPRNILPHSHPTNMYRIQYLHITIHWQFPDMLRLVANVCDVWCCAGDVWVMCEQFHRPLNDSRTLVYELYVT